MRRLASLLFISLLCTACTGTTGSTNRSNVRWEKLMENPLYAQHYWDDLTDRMVELQVQDKDIQASAEKLALVDEVRRMALERSQTETRRRREGVSGSFVNGKELTEGIVLLRNKTLSFSYDFLTSPGPSLRIYLSKSIDPRDAQFPDETAVEIGRLESPYGAQEYLPPGNVQTEDTFRSVVLFDTKLERLYGFAQLQ